MAERASNAWLASTLPRTIQPVSYFDTERFLNFVPQSLFQTLWYNGGWNQNIAPFGIYFVLWCIAAACLFETCKAQFLIPKPCLTLSKSLCLWSSASGGILAVFIIARQATQAEGRIALPALSAFAILLTFGSRALFRGTRLSWLSLWLWPLALTLFNLYVIFTFVLPICQL